MSKSLSFYESDSEESESETDDKILKRKTNNYELINTFETIEEAKDFLREKKFAFQYRSKPDPKTDRKVCIFLTYDWDHSQAHKLSNFLTS